MEDRLEDDEDLKWAFPGNGSAVSWRELGLVMSPVYGKLNSMDKKLNVLTGDWYEDRGAARERRHAAENKRRFHERWYGRATLACTIVAALGGLGYLIAYLILTVSPPH